MTHFRLQSNIVTAAAAAASVLGLTYALSQLEIPSMLRQRQRSRKVEPRCYSADEKQSLEAFKALTAQTPLLSTYPLAAAVQKKVLIYDASTFKLHDADFVEKLKDELYHALVHGPGVYVIKGFFSDTTCIDTANDAYITIINREAAASGIKGDHFAAGGLNNRIWNSFSKHGLQDPKSFFEYFSNPLFKIVCDSYLGPAYRLTSQVNIVKPGGKPQTSHRDYHLGFQTTGDCAKWPKAMHNTSALLTLQGAVAHSDMSLESGPTRVLPYSQSFGPGFMAYRDSSFNDYFLDSWVSLPLQKGDAVFFSPALFHAAGENITTDVNRSNNLIQVSSAFGKPMESIDALPLVARTWDFLQSRYRAEGMSAEVDAFICAVAEGYPFPTNLDRRPPAPGGMAPESEQDLLRRGINEGWDKEQAVQELTSMREASAAVTEASTDYGASDIPFNRY